MPPLDFASWRESLEGPQRAFEGCVTIGCSAGSLDAAARFLEHDGVHGAFGIHPLNAGEWSEDVEAKLRRLMALPKAVAWGECGLDYYDKKSGRGLTPGICPHFDQRRAVQRDVFTAQLRIAVAFGKPLVLHTRMAEEDTLELLAEHLPRHHPVHAHCFTSSAAMARHLLERFPELCLGFTGVVSFPTADYVREVVAETPLERVLLETDGPYMAPVPHRGRIAHPGHVYHVAEAVARVKGLGVQEVLRTCRANAKRMYGF